MAVHEFITCDICNRDGDIDMSAIGGVDDGLSSQFYGTVEQAEEIGWSVDEGDPHCEHMCPACTEDEEEEVADLEGDP